MWQLFVVAAHSTWSERVGFASHGPRRVEYGDHADEWRKRMLHTVPGERAAVISGDPRGLTSADVIASRGRFGINDIVVAPPSGWRDVLRDTVRDPMIWFLTATALLKGAPETIIGMTAISPAEREEWLRKTIEFASSGHKVIACARRELEAWQGGEADRNYTLLGLLAFEDPVRPTAVEAVKQARAAGIRVIMVTGDHPATARAIAQEAGSGADPPRVVDGPELSGYLQASAAAGLNNIDVVARCIPAQKLDLVRALQASGEIVAVTGDGVNDVPALQGADIGIAMGERGTRSAREVASIVLLDDNFRTIVGAIAEGRQLFENLKLSFAYLLMVHIPLVLTAAFIPFAGYPLLYLPARIVWLELIIHPTALLVFPQAPSSQQLRAVKRSSRLRFFDPVEWTIICVVGLAVTGVIAMGYVRSLGPAEDVEHARSMAMVVLIAASATITAGLSGLRTRNSAIVVAASLVSAAVLVQFAPVARLLHLSPLHADDWLLAGAAGLAAGALASLIMWRRRVRNGEPYRAERSPDT